MLGPDCKILLINGIPRTGTTLMINWLEHAWPFENICLRESNLTELAFNTYRLFEFTATNHETGINFSKTGKQRLEALESLSKWIFRLYELKSNKRNIEWVLDKLPIMVPFGINYYQALLEIFPNIKMIYMIREPREVLSSMVKRTWTRGPYPKLNYMSPFIEDILEYPQYDICIDINNINTSIPVPYLNNPIMWSLRKCCRNYSNAITSIEKVIQIDKPYLIIDYNDLSTPKKVSEVVGQFTGVKLNALLEFDHKTRNIFFSSTDEEIIKEELEDTGVIEMYRRLKLHSLKI